MISRSLCEVSEKLWHPWSSLKQAAQYEHEKYIRNLQRERYSGDGREGLNGGEKEGKSEREN